VTAYTHRFFATPLANVATARALVKFFADGVAPGTADGMFAVGYRTIGSTGGATDYVSSGPIDAQFASLLGDANTTFAVYQAKGGTTITLADIQALYTACPLGTRIRSDAKGQEQACIAALSLQTLPGTI
jgi:hypothetical protein